MTGAKRPDEALDDERERDHADHDCGDDRKLIEVSGVVPRISDPANRRERERGSASGGYDPDVSPYVAKGHLVNHSLAALDVSMSPGIRSVSRRTSEVRQGIWRVPEVQPVKLSVRTRPGVEQGLLRPAQGKSDRSIEVVAVGLVVEVVRATDGAREIFDRGDQKSEMAFIYPMQLIGVSSIDLEKTVEAQDLPFVGAPGLDGEESSFDPKPIESFAF